MWRGGRGGRVAQRLRRQADGGERCGGRAEPALGVEERELQHAHVAAQQRVRVRRRRHAVGGGGSLQQEGEQRLHQLPVPRPWGAWTGGWVVGVLRCGPVGAGGHLAKSSSDCRMRPWRTAAAVHTTGSVCGLGAASQRSSAAWSCCTASAASSVCRYSSSAAVAWACSDRLSGALEQPQTASAERRRQDGSRASSCARLVRAVQAFESDILVVGVGSRSSSVGGLQRSRTRGAGEARSGNRESNSNGHSKS